LSVYHEYASLVARRKLSKGNNFHFRSSVNGAKSSIGDIKEDTTAMSNKDAG